MGIVFSCGLLMCAFAQAKNCEQGNENLALAKERINASADGEALDQLHRSIAACPSYDAYELLGEVLSRSDARRDRKSAVDAFVSAIALARSPKDRAQSLFQYALLLNREGDPQNAYPLIQRARSLDPSRRAINNLADDVAKQVQNPKSEQLTRALVYSLYKPVKGMGRPRKGATSAYEQPSINLPIYFETNSTEVDEKTKENVAELAKTLSDGALAGRKIVFVGHSDERGDELYNDDLSLKRAKAISEAVVEINPQLKGAIRVEGHGAREPINLGTDESALRENRRLQVIAK